MLFVRIEREREKKKKKELFNISFLPPYSYLLISPVSYISILAIPSVSFQPVLNHFSRN